MVGHTGILPLRPSRAIEAVGCRLASVLAARAGGDGRA